MRRGKCWLLVSAVLVSVLVSHTGAVQPFRRVSLATTAATSTSTTTTTTTTPEIPTAEAEDEKLDNSTLSAAAAAARAKNSKLTGIPQIDYIWDPNLPRELRGYNLSSYPFFASVPPEEDITFKCEGHHDGFYASIEHKCQLYHHCVYGIRHDFLCANFTAFDQKTFICHFVSDVDCENSFKYWNRNDDLYMATTTTSTTTTTTEPPPTTRRRPILRPNRPLRRPMNRRPLDDYYYEDEVEYEDEDYYEERVNRRRKQRPRPRKPAVDYEDDYEDEKRSFASNDDQPRRGNSRDRFRGSDDNLDEDYAEVDRRKYDRPNSRAKANDKRKSSGRKSGAANERRSFGDDRPVAARKDKTRPVLDESEEEELAPPAPTRRSAGRRRIGSKRPPAAPAALDVAEDDVHLYSDAETAASAAAAAEAPDGSAAPKATSKPPEDFITPKAAPASVYARPRAPPRIARPVPVNEKKKFQYSAQKAGATTTRPAAPAAEEEEDYYEDELGYEEPAAQPVAHPPRRRVHDEDDLPPPPPARKSPAAGGRKPPRPSLHKPATNKKPVVDSPDEEAEYDNASNASSERLDSRPSARKRPLTSRSRTSLAPARGSEDLDFVDDDYEERPLRPAHRLRPNKAARKNFKKARPQYLEDEEEPFDDERGTEPERPLRSRTAAAASAAGRRKKVALQRQRVSTAAPPLDEVAANEPVEDVEDEAQEPPIRSPASGAAAGRSNAVRVVKRPFLPSRGGSPYLPRGLQPVGVALKPTQSAHTTASPSPLDMGSTISGVHLLEHGAPLLRGSGAAREFASQAPRTTLAPRSPLPAVVTQQAQRTEDAAPAPAPKVTLDELYENDYDVTLNDALNPTLKPLSSHQSHPYNRNYASAFAPFAEAFVDHNRPSQPATHHNNNNYQPQHSKHHPLEQLSPQTQSQSQSQSQSQAHQLPSSPQQQPQPQQQEQEFPQTAYNSDSYFSSTDIRRRAVFPALAARPSRTDLRGVSARIAQHFYEDLEY